MTIPASTQFVLIHGSWLGGWCWKSFQQALVRYGQKSTAPDLLGMGDLAPMVTKDTGLAAHAAGIYEHIAAIDADSIVLVGHSYGAAVASEVAGIDPARISAFVNLDGFITEVGKSLYLSYPALKAIGEQLTDPTNPDFILPPPAELLGLSPSDATTQAMARLCLTPHRVNAENARFSANDLTCPRIYIRFAGFPFFAETAQNAHESGWQVSELDIGHMGILTDPELVADRVMQALST